MDSISRQAAIDAVMGQPPEPHYPSWYAEQIKALPSAQPSDDYNRGWEDGQNALREEQWENGRDRFD